MVSTELVYFVKILVNNKLARIKLCGCQGCLLINIIAGCGLFNDGGLIENRRAKKKNGKRNRFS